MWINRCDNDRGFVCSAKMQNFMTETGLFGMFQIINGVEPNQREATHEHIIKFTDHVLATEGMLRNTAGIETIDCSEKIESDHRGYLTHVCFSDYFSEEFVEAHRRSIRISIQIEKRTEKDL